MPSRLKWKSGPDGGPEFLFCQPVCKPGSVRLSGFPKSAVIIHLGPGLPPASTQPTRTTGLKTGWQVALPRCPYSVLLPMGFTVPLPLLASAVGSYPTISPLPAGCFRFLEAVSFCCTFPWVGGQARFPSRKLSGIVFPWSPDFPPSQPFGSRDSNHPTGWQMDIVPKRPKGQPHMPRARFWPPSCAQTGAG